MKDLAERFPNTALNVLGKKSGKEAEIYKGIAYVKLFESSGRREYLKRAIQFLKGKEDMLAKKYLYLSLLYLGDKKEAEKLAEDLGGMFIDVRWSNFSYTDLLFYLGDKRLVEIYYAIREIDLPKAFLRALRFVYGDKPVSNLVLQHIYVTFNRIERECPSLPREEKHLLTIILFFSPGENPKDFLIGNAVNRKLLKGYAKKVFEKVRHVIFPEEAEKEVAYILPTEMRELREMLHTGKVNHERFERLVEKILLLFPEEGKKMIEEIIDASPLLTLEKRELKKILERKAA